MQGPQEGAVEVLEEQTVGREDHVESALCSGTATATAGSSAGAVATVAAIDIDIE